MTYDLETVARMSLLSTRSLRNHIKSGLLTGHMEKGKWYFSEDDLKHFFDEPFIKTGFQSKTNALVNRFLEEKKKRASTCMMIDIPGEEVQLNSLCDVVLEYFNTCVDHQKDERITYQYDSKDKTGRFLMIGSLEMICAMAEILNSAVAV